MKTITLPADVEHLYLDELAELIAFALWPNSEKNYKSALELLKPELEQAAIEGSLVTKNPLTRQTIPPVMPTDDPLDRLFSTAYTSPPEYRIVTVPDLTAYVAARGIAVAMEAPEQSTQPQAAPEQEAVTPAPEAKSASNAPAKARRDLLAPVIETAQKEVGDSFDAPAVWAVLVRMAGAKKLPLLGVSDDGIKWQDSNDEPQFFKLKNLRDRLKRKKNSAVERDKAR